MPTVVGVRLRFSKTLWFDPAGTEPNEGDTVLVETERGTEFGSVVHGLHDVPAADLPAALKPVLRVATEEDRAYAEELSEKERTAMPVFRELVEEQRLDMKPIDVEYLYDGDKVVFYFSAEERVDFRELVKELASRFHARIDMRQVGVRDEARRVGGVGHCGQMLCCVRLGGDFQPVSIRMAKEQDLPLNPLKISGLCGRLMCCLRYEFDAYKDYKSRAPKRGAMIETPTGNAKVTDLNTPKETVSLRLEDGTNVTVPLSAMECGKGEGCPCAIGREALEAASGPPPLTARVPDRTPVLEVSEPETPERPGQAETGQGGGGRRRRRRGKGGSDTQSAQPEAQQGTPKQEPATQADGDKPAKTPRRRRRRRPGGGSGNKAS